MPGQISDVDDIINSNELARRLGLNSVTPRIWVHKNIGPPFIRTDGVRMIRYSWRAVTEWMASQTVTPPHAMTTVLQNFAKASPQSRVAVESGTNDGVSEAFRDDSQRRVVKRRVAKAASAKPLPAHELLRLQKRGAK